jgi:Spy/CpxP family protein refolding chaperone
MVRKILALAALVWMLAAGAACAQGPGGADPMAEALIPPDVIMEHQQALGLSDAQRKAIEADAQNAQQRFTQLQWRLAAATEKLADMLKQNHVDQAKAIAQLDAVLDVEREIKHTQLGLMIQVKNELSPDQQAMAHKLMSAGPK